MRIAFLYSEMETLGIQYISSVLKLHGHDTRLFFDPVLFMDTVTRNQFLGRLFDYTDKLLSDLCAYQPDIVAFSVLSSNYDWACSLAGKIKQTMDVPVIFGGIHPTVMYKEVLSQPFVDMVMRGEGEKSMLALLESGLNSSEWGMIKNLCYKKGARLVCNPLGDLEMDLDRLPFPDKRLFYDPMPYLQENYTVVTSRGCPHDCTYCCNGYLNRLYLRKYLRRRSPGNVIAELVWARQNFKVKHIFFDDSTFSYDRRWLKEFVKEYKRQIGLPSFCWVHPNDVGPELIALLSEMNCRAVEMGVESLDGEVRRKVFHRFYDNTVVEQAIRLFNAHHIFCIVDNIKGFSTDPEAEMQEMVSFYNKNRPHKIYIFEHRNFPGTELTKRLSEQGGHEESLSLPFTIATKDTSRVVRQLELLAVLIYVFPQRLIEFILRKKLYRNFPPVAAYNILELFPFVKNLFKMGRKRLWYPVRGTRHRYLFFIWKGTGYFLKRVTKRWE